MKAAIWARVSSGEQDTSSQLGELRAWADRRGLNIAAEYVLDGASAWKGINLRAKTLAVRQARVLVDYQVRIEEPTSRNGYSTLPSTTSSSAR